MKPPFSDLNRIPRDALLFRLNFLAAEVADANAVLGHDGDLAVGQEEDVARVFENRRNVGRYEEFAIAKTHDHGRALTRGNNRIRVIG